MMINAWFQQPLITDIFVMLGVVLLNQLLLRGIMNFTINAGQKIDYSVGILNVVSVGYFAVLAIYFQYLGYDLQSDVALVNFRILILIYTMIYLGRRGSAVVVLADCASRAAFYGLTLNTYESWTTEVTVWLVMALIATIAKRIHLHLLTLVMVINCVGGGFWLLAYFLQLRRVAPLSGEAALGHFVSFIILNGLLAYVLCALDNENNHLSAITYEATYDPLTRLQNYGMFDKHYEELFKRYHLRNAPLSMIAIDIDWFKSLNDQYGHLAGNQVLATIGRWPLPCQWVLPSCRWRTRRPVISMNGRTGCCTSLRVRGEIRSRWIPASSEKSPKRAPNRRPALSIDISRYSGIIGK